MFGGNSTMPFTMPVEPAYGGGSNGGGWSDGWLIWIVLIFALFGWGGNGFGGGFGGGGSAATQGALTREQACIDNNFQNLMRETASISDAVNLGFANLNSTICNQQYDTAQMLNQMNITNLQNANAANVVALQNQNALQTQIANCCCGIERLIESINFTIAQQTCNLTNQMNNNTRDIIDAQNAGTREILDYLCNKENQNLRDENQALRLAASQQKQTNEIVSELLPVAKPAYLTCSPYASAFGFGYGNGYGFNGYNGYNNGCGCGC